MWSSALRRWPLAESVVFTALCTLTIYRTDYASGDQHSPTGLAWKVLPVVWLAASAWFWSLDGRLRRLHTAALVASAAGDLFIGFMHISKTCFALSMLAFAVGHFCYVRSFWRGRAELEWSLLVPLLPLAALGSWSLWMTWERLHREPALIVGLLRGYSAVLLATTLAAASEAVQKGARASDTLRAFGLLIFCFSDSLILLDNFSSLSLPQPTTHIVVIATYYLALLLIYAASVLRHRHH